MTDKQWVKLLFGVLRRLAPDNAEIRQLEEMYHAEN